MMTLNVCQAGHTFHESKQVTNDYGQWRIWDWPRYMDFPGYCTGQDEVSKSIDLAGGWERPDTDYMIAVLEDQPGTMLDFGAHIGWFSIQALELGCPVVVVDADPENIRLWEANYDLRFPSNTTFVTLNSRVLHCMIANRWAVDIGDLGIIPDDQIRFMKVDIEGHEHEALNLTRHLWAEQKIDYGLWELSPIFENREGINSPSYAELVDEIASYGYRWFILKDEGEWEITGADLTFPQENAWCEKI